MGSIKRKYENRYWLDNDDVFELHFTQFYDDEVILKFKQDKDDPEIYIYVSDLLKVEYDIIEADSVGDAIGQFEDMIIDYIQDKFNYYEEMLEKFQEESYE